MVSTPLQDLARSIKLLQHRHRRLMDIRLAEMGTTLVQWDALRAISGNPNASSHDLAETTFQTDQSFGALAARLTERGLIIRTPGKGRVLCHSLTKDGLAVLDRASEAVNDVLSESFAPLAESERTVLLSLVRRLLPVARQVG